MDQALTQVCHTLLLSLFEPLTEISVHRIVSKCWVERNRTKGNPSYYIVCHSTFETDIFVLNFSQCKAFRQAIEN